MAVMHRPCPVWAAFTDGEYEPVDDSDNCYNCGQGIEHHPARVIGG